MSHAAALEPIVTAAAYSLTGTGIQRKFVVTSNGMHEVQKAVPSMPRTWIIDQTFHAGVYQSWLSLLLLPYFESLTDGSVYIITPVDPLFLVIDCIYDAPRRFLPASQLFSDLSGRVKRSGMPTPGVTSSKGSASLAGNTWEAAAVHWVQDTLPRIATAQLPLIMDVNSSMGEKSLLYKLSEGKLGAWLATKAVVAARHLAATSETHGAPTAMSSSFSLTSASADTSVESGTAAEGSLKGVQGGLPTTAWLEEGLDLLAEYVGDKPLELARARLGLAVDVVAPPAAAPAAAAGTAQAQDGAKGGQQASQDASGSLQRAAAWASAGSSGSGIIDPSKYRAAAAEGSDAVGGVKRKPEAVQTPAAKRLAKTDTRGMKSMMAFFKTKG